MPELIDTEYLADLREEAPDHWLEETQELWCKLEKPESFREARIREKEILGLRHSVFDEEKLNKLRTSLEDIRSECSKPGWDGYGAAPISADALSEAEALLRVLPASLPAPDIVPEPTGTVGLEWRKGKDAILVLSVQGKGVITYAAILGAEIKRYGMEKFETVVPQFIQELLHYFF